MIFSRLPHHPILCYSCQLPQGLPKNPPAPRARGSVSTLPPVPNADLPVLAHPSSLPPVDPLSTLASPSSLLSVSSQHQETLPTQAHHGCTWQDLRSIPCQATNPQLPHSPRGGNRNQGTEDHPNKDKNRYQHPELQSSQTQMPTCQRKNPVPDRAMSPLEPSNSTTAALGNAVRETQDRDLRIAIMSMLRALKEDMNKSIHENTNSGMK